MPDLSVIVPAVNEEGWIEDTLRAARRALGPDAELIVVDGESTDRTRAIARHHARVLVHPPGRGPQLNRGAAAASGDVLLFLHADTHLAPESGAALRGALTEGAELGCHRFGVHPPPGAKSRYALLERAVNLRTSIFRTATGDQAIFVTRSLFRRVGGFPDVPLFEDVEFVRRARREAPLRVLSASARTSRRRWEARGFWRTVLLHWLLRLAHLAGAPPRLLASWYGRCGGEASAGVSSRTADR